jgi:ligand-binding sensor domain-containing protein
MSVCRVLVAMFVCATAAFGGVGDWKTFTSKREVRDLTVDRSGIIWAATSGGMFSFNPADSSFGQFTTSEGLRTIDLTAIAIDSSGSIWTGAGNGFLHRYDPSTNSWRYVSDIALRSDPFKRINALQVYGDTLFILSDIGVSVFSISRMEFGDTYARFGTAPYQEIGNATSILLTDFNLWIGTRNGLASTPRTNPNPSVPESWQLFTTANGLPSTMVNTLISDGTILFAGTANGTALSREPTGVWMTDSATVGLNIIDYSIDHVPCLDCPTLYFITPTALWSTGGLSPGPGIVASGFPSNLTTFVRSSTQFNDIVGTDNNGLIALSNTTRTAVLPPGPPSNEFVSVAVDQRSVVWAATGVANNEGFMSFNGSTWKSYTTAQDSTLGNDNYWKVSIGKDNAKWVGSWGGGVALLDDQGTLRKVLNTSNGLSPTIDPTFVVVGGVATDQNGVAWITDRTGRGDTALVTFGPDSSISYVRGLSTRNAPLKVFEDVIIDQNATKWFSNFSRFEGVLPVGLYYYNERFALPGTVNGWGLLTTNEGLTTNKIYSLAMGQEGDVWVGSDEGISIIFNPGSPRQVHPFHPLRDQIIQAIVVDPLNNKWIGTRQGVFVLSPDGTSILNRYTVENTDGKLLDNDVASIAVDSRTGTMYFGTEKGLSSLGTPAAAPNRSFSELFFAPNPFYLPSNKNLTIDGLTQNSLIKVLTIDGNLIKEIRSPGGRIGFWDGTDLRGNMVGTGIYLIVAYSEDGSKAASGKVAVVRR